MLVKFIFLNFALVTSKHLHKLFKPIPSTLTFYAQAFECIKKKITSIPYEQENMQHLLHGCIILFAYEFGIS